ncbi:uncharacterized protein LOC124935256 [Impatiens glandulifera]|uniref:uncharacterized protein LOC124935256 n=1 Tax=Impatiens glandulifera TaxID=253017 RepID=UPI001FB06715|nr:uncharacterized protein LOC124935256 [Impatiens glandulifera]
MTTKKLSLKLLYDKESKKVLFAEAGKESVDFLLNILSLPLATVISLLSNSKKGMVGCLSNLYKSVEILDQTYIQNGQIKDSLLNPVPLISQTHLLLPNSPNNVPTPKWNNIKIYKCSNKSCGYRNYYVKDPNLVCRSCHHLMNCLEEDPDVLLGKEAAAVVSNEGGGFVKDMNTYMVMDNLEIKPMSTISGICLLNQFNVNNVRNLQEKVVDFGMDEGLQILEASLQGKDVLTKVFVPMVV